MLRAVEGYDQGVVMTDSGFAGEKMSVGDKLRKTRAIVIRIPAFSAYNRLERTATDEFSFENMRPAAGRILIAFPVYHNRQMAHCLIGGDDHFGI